ncbi:RICIN domain-containing protein [Streptomyces griseoviridis]|uniref:RICIN domain-containing protein n=1 Tax=Streptomyces griseoviridis TaxID=45398 RepID=UPI0033E4C6A5
MRNRIAVIAATVLVAGGALATSQTASAATEVPAAGQQHSKTATNSDSGLHLNSTWNKNFVNGLYGTCLDDSSGAGLRMNTCSDASYNNGYQKWAATENGGYLKFKNAKTGLCLDGSSGAGVRSYTCSQASYDNGYQKWVIYASAGGWVNFGNWATGECMDYSAGSGLRLHTCSVASLNNGYQAWNY